MTAPLASVLCGLLPPAIIGGAQPQVFLDVATGPDTTPTLLVDVRSNDPIQGNITSPVIASGPAGASVVVIGNQIQLTHNGAGVYVINYTSTIGALSDLGTLTAIITTGGVVGAPPAIAPITYQLAEGSNALTDTLTIPSAQALPANTRALLVGIGAWSDAFGQAEPQTITALSATYAGFPMTRLDTFGSDFYIGNDGSPTGVGPAVYAFVLLSTPTFSLPTSGDINWSFTLSSGQSELFAAAAVPITHPSRDLVASELNKIRAVGNQSSSLVAATAGDNSALVNFNIHKRQVVPTSDANWTEQERVIVDNTSDIQSGRLLAETRIFSVGGNANYTVSASQANLHGSTTIQLQDTAGGGAPSAINVNANATSGGSQITIDMSAAGAPITAVNIRSGGGSVMFAGTDILFTPPSTDETTVIECSQANLAGGVVSTATVTSTSVSIGPQVGPAVNIGQTETSLAAINTAVQVARTTFEAELRGLHDARVAGTTDAQIIANNPGFVTLTGKSLGDLNNALNAGNRRLFLTAAGGDYNWAGTKPNFDDIELKGLVDNGMPAVVVGGTPQNRGQLQFRIRGQGGSVEGIEFKDSALCFSFVGATGIIPRFHADFCKFTNVGNSVHMEFGGAFGNVNSGSGCSSVRFNNCIAENVSHGLNMRCGPGYGETGSPPSSPDFQIGAFEAIESIVKDHDNMGICCHFDTRGGTSASVFWPGIGSGSVGLVRRCLIDRRTIGSLNGFPCNLTACEESQMEETFFTNTLSNAFGRDDDVYTKSRIGHVRNCVIWNTGTSTNFQGQLGCKGEGNPGSLPLGLYAIENNLVGHDDSVDISRCVFIQRSNVRLANNAMIIATGSNNEGGGITQQGGGDGYSNMTSVGNLYRVFGGFSQSTVAQCSANISDWSFTDDVIETRRAGSHTLIQLRNSSGFSHLDTVMRRVTFRKIAGAGTTTAITVQPSGTLRNPVIDDCDFEDINTAIAISGGTVTGAVTFTNNQHTGTTPSTSNSTGSTVNTFGGGGGNSF